MKLFIVLAIICAVCNGYPFQAPAEGAPKAPPAPKPQEPPKGLTDYGYGNEGAYIKHKQTLVNNDNYKLDGTAYASKNFHERTPLITGGIVDLAHKPTQSEVNVRVENQRGSGTKLTSGGQYNFFQTRDGRGKVGAYGEYSRHYNSPFGSQRPQYGYGIRGSYAF